MPVNPETTVRKLTSLPRELWARIEAYMAARDLKSESKALLALIESGLKQAERKRKPR